MDVEGKWSTTLGWLLREERRGRGMLRKGCNTMQYSDWLEGGTLMEA
jgi:hypothetical protein